MIYLVITLWLGSAQGADSGTPLPGPELWRTSADATPFWDIHGDGLIDVIDLVYFRDTWFEDITLAAGIAASHNPTSEYYGIGQAWGDYDNDGFLDLYVTDILGPNSLFRNLGNGAFSDDSYKAGTANLGHSMGVAYADYDRDGFLDMVVGNRGEGYLLYRNRGMAGAGRDWLNLRLVGSGPVNRNAIGSRVFLSLSDGRTLMQEVKCGSSLGSGKDMALHFGLGNSSVPQMIVVWPDQTAEAFGSQTPNHFMEITYPNQLAEINPWRKRAQILVKVTFQGGVFKAKDKTAEIAGSAVGTQYPRNGGDIWNFLPRKKSNTGKGTARNNQGKEKKP